MRFFLGLPTDDVHNHEEFGTARAVSEMASAAERLGYEGVYVTDHPAPTARFIETGGHHALEPTVVLAVAAAATTRLRLLTNLYIVAYRNPFIAAKAIASLDSLSDGRVILGTGAGYLEPEFRALGANFEQRNEQLDEWLRLIRRIWSGEAVEASGPGYEAEGNLALPAPVRAGGPPIWIGGNSRRALHRAAEFGQGWIPMAAPRRFARYVRSAPLETLEDLGSRLTEMRARAEELGRSEPLDVMFGPMSAGSPGQPDFEPAAYLDEAARLGDLGVGYAGVGFAHPGTSGLASRARFLELAEEFAETIVSKSR